RGDLARHDGEPGVGLRCHLATMTLRSRLGDLMGLGRALHGLGTIFMAEGQSDLAERYYGRALHLRAEVGDLAGQADSANNMGVLLRKIGRTAEAIDHYRTSLRIRRQIGHTAGEGFSYINIARVYYERRELDAAVKYYDRALQVARRLSDARSQAQVLNALGAVAHLHDRFVAAIRHYEEAERLDRMVGNLKGALVKRLNLAAEYLRVGDLDRGGQLVETVARVQRWRDDHELDGWLRLLAGRLHLAAGRNAAAREALAIAAEDAEAASDAEFAAEVGIARAEVELRMGRGSQALEVLPPEFDGLSREATARIAIVRARALLLGAGEDRNAVEAQVEEGERFARRARMTGLEWQCARCRGALRAAVEDRSQSLASYATALEALETILDGLSDSDLLDGFIASHDVRSFVEEVDELASGLAKSERSMLPGVAGALVRSVRESLFEARRQVGLQEGVSRKNEEMMRRILEISRALRSTAPLDDLFRQIVDGVVEFSGAERAFLLTVDERGRIRIPVARSREREPISEPQQQVSRRIISEVLEKARSMRITDAGGAYATAESVVNLDLRSIMCAPMMRGSLVVGMLYVDNRSRAGQFTGADQELLDIFAAQAAIALENARLVREFARDEKIRVMGNLAGGVAHDFNNLLTAILGRAQQLTELTDDDRILGGLDTIMKAAQDGSVVVSRLQEFTRTRREGSFRSVNLGEVITDVLEFTRTR
ncbi:MAG: tetratricopeptide repeat protein, partial [Planctomycetes bacterium]|nr:tetratricopeptide repeat protein [Planctomycetota bacterium]